MKHLLFVVLLILTCSCQDNVSEDSAGMHLSLVTRSVSQDYFDWETADFMPVPQGMTPVNSPWIGAGSLIGSYDLDVVNDRKKSEGWVLLYNTFTTDATKFTPNPYFVLYNKYRGTMRIYYYITDSFITTSSNVIENLSLFSGDYNSYLLNYADCEAIDNSDIRTSIQRIQSKPLDGSMPVAAHRWYMAEYELAYDPEIANIPYDKIKLNFGLNYRNITEIKLNGTIVGDIEGTIGEQKKGEFVKAFNKETGKAVLSNVSYKALKALGNEKTGENKIGLSNDTYKNLLNKAGSIASDAVGGVWGAAVGLLNSMLFGTKTASSTPFKANIHTNMEASGSVTNDGSMPSMPISMYVPGTDIPANAPGRLPLYNKILGVVKLDGRPCIDIHIHTTYQNRFDDPYCPGQIYTETTERLTVSQHHPFEEFLKFNPEVEKIADITVLNEEIFGITEDGYVVSDPDMTTRYGETGTSRQPFPDFKYGVCFVIKVQPKDGTPATIFSKSFIIDNTVSTSTAWLPDAQ